MHLIFQVALFSLFKSLKMGWKISVINQFINLINPIFVLMISGKIDETQSLKRNQKKQSPTDEKLLNMHCSLLARLGL